MRADQEWHAQKNAEVGNAILGVLALPHEGVEILAEMSDDLDCRGRDHTVWVVAGCPAAALTASKSLHFSNRHSATNQRV